MIDYFTSLTLQTRRQQFYLREGESFVCGCTYAHEPRCVSKGSGTHRLPSMPTRGWLHRVMDAPLRGLSHDKAFVIDQYGDSRGNMQQQEDNSS